MADEQLVEIHLLGLHAQDHRDTFEHIDGLVREFIFLGDDPADVPTRLIELRNDIRARFRSFAASGLAAIDAAAAGGEPTVDVVMRVPASAGAVAALALRTLDEADDYCRRGSLLTLAAGESVVRYRRWFFGEFVRQVEGSSPTPWAHEAQPRA
jgi:hypothetical protein